MALIALPPGGEPRVGATSWSAPVEDVTPPTLAAVSAPTYARELEADAEAFAAPPITAPSGDVPWSTGPEVGTGVAAKDTGNPRGENAFVGYAGYGVSQDDAEAWVDALYRAWLEERGVRYLWAVRGPDDSHYENKEIGNVKVAAGLCSVAPAAAFVLVAAHSSGSCVAHELFKHLAEGKDPEGLLAGKIVYFNLDGIEKGLTPASVARLRRAYFVAALDRATGTSSPNEGEMRRSAALYGRWAAAEYVELDARGAGCARGGSWCLHASLVTNAPHDPRAARAHLDYTDFSSGGVATAFLDAKAADARLLVPR